MTSTSAVGVKLELSGRLFNAAIYHTAHLYSCNYSPPEMSQGCSHGWPVTHKIVKL